MSQVPPAVPLAAPASAAARPLARQSWEALRVFARNPSAVAGVLLLAVILAVTIFGPMAMQADPFEIAGAPMSPPGEDALLGTDYLGRDVLTGMVYGGRATLLVGVVAAVLSMAIGLTVGALAGHKCLATTMRYAGHLPEGATVEAIRRLENPPTDANRKAKGDTAGDTAKSADAHRDAATA